MKVTIDTATNTIIVPTNTNLGLIIAELKKIFPNGEWSNFDLKPEYPPYNPGTATWTVPHYSPGTFAPIGSIGPLTNSPTITPSTTISSYRIYGDPTNCSSSTI